jgi:RHS repeat-associated protein
MILREKSGVGNCKATGQYCRRQRYDPNDNIQAIRDQLNDTNSLYYGYDANDRLKQTSLVAGSPTTGTESYSYTSGTNRLSSVTNVSGTRSITYDGRGNTASESRPGSVSATTSYDGYGRLTGYARTDVGSLSFAYNGQDDRVAMTSGTGPRRFVYDTDGRVLGEYGASASDVKAEFIWALPQVANDNSPFGGDDGVGGYAPLAVATPDSGGTVQLNWVHGNHLGVPIVTTDASGNAATTPNDYLAPGFPGQSRVIADLYYNRYRDYDPGTGRYIQADPIGLEGGSNPYLYANANPIRYTDPSGLDPVGGAIGGVIGGWAGGAVGALAGPEGIPIGAMAGRWGGRIIGSAIGDACIAAGNDDDRDPQCHKASKYELRQAGIYDEHEYKIEHGARPPSRFDICKCRDGSIRIAPVGQCGKTRNFW